MDEAVLKAYGWEDLIPQCKCEFLLDYEDEDEEDGKAGKGRNPTAIAGLTTFEMRFLPDS